MRKLLRNSIITPDGTELISRFRHDYVSYKDTNGKTYAIDGGTNYQRIVGDFQDCEDTSLYSDDTIEVLRRGLSWGTYGKEGTDKLKYVLIEDMNDEHLKAAYGSLPNTANYKDVFKRELEYRNKKDTK